MKMANPFLFDASSLSSGQENPFLSNSLSTKPSNSSQTNPFLAEHTSLDDQKNQWQRSLLQRNYYNQPQVPSVTQTGSNPFDDFELERIQQFEYHISVEPQNELFNVGSYGVQNECSYPQPSYSAVPSEPLNVTKSASKASPKSQRRNFNAVSTLQETLDSQETLKANLQLDTLEGKNTNVKEADKIANTVETIDQTHIPPPVPPKWQFSDSPGEVKKDETVSENGEFLPPPSKAMSNMALQITKDKENYETVKSEIPKRLEVLEESNFDETFMKLEETKNKNGRKCEYDLSGQEKSEKIPIESKKIEHIEVVSFEKNEIQGSSTGAALFELSNEPFVEENSSVDSKEEKNSPKMISTGDAIFANIPAADVKSTGASIFGLSEESAANSTGANIFGVMAPKETQPILGSMSGWDDNFDRKFESASPTTTGDPFVPFKGNTLYGSEFATGTSFYGFEDNSFCQASYDQVATKPTDKQFLSLGEASTAYLNEYNQKKYDDFDSPLFDDDISKPLESFPRIFCERTGWELFIRHPPKKKLTAQRFWKKIFVRIVMQGDTPCISLFENKDTKDAFQEIPLQPTYSLSEITHQVFDQYTKIFTLKLQYIFYKERAGIRPGQISKMQKLTDKIGFLARAVEDADYQGVKEFASDMKKLGVPLEHAPQITELLKVGSNNYEDLKQFSVCIEEKLFQMEAHRDRALQYKTEEIQLTAVDEVYVEQDKSGHVKKQLCRVRVFFLSFLSGMPIVELGVNDIERMGLEVVGRHDILPIPTEQWIRYEDIEFHNIVNKEDFKNYHIIKFQPPDACYLEIMRFRVRPPAARELPMQARCKFIISGNKVEIRADMMIPFPHTKAWGQVPCEDIAMRIPLPECWIYQFRTEKHHVSLSQLAAGNLNIGTRMGSVKSAHRRAGKVKGLERFIGTIETQTQDLMETSSGQAKYEHQHKAIVWRVPRLPKHGQGSYTNHEFVCKLTLTSYDQMPETFEKHFYVEFTQPATAISNTVLRSVSIQDGSDEPPEKFVKYLTRHEYKLDIDFAEKEESTYLSVTKKVKMPETETDKAYPDFPDENGEGRNFSESDSD